MTAGCCDERAKKAGREPATFKDNTSERTPISSVIDDFKANASSRPPSAVITGAIMKMISYY